MVILAVGVGYVFLQNKNAKAETKEKYNGILRLWQIDSCEGGKGSRAAFLNRVAAKFEKKHGGVYVMVTGYTAEGAAAAIAEGDAPDLISFSCGVDGLAELCLALTERFEGGVIGDGCYAYPWCAGRYYLFSLEEDFSAVSAETFV